MTDQIRNYLRQLQYSCMRTNLQYAEIWMRKNPEKARAVVFLEQKEQRFLPEAVKNVHFQLERKLYLENIRDVQVLICILTEEPEKARNMTELGIPVWILDMAEKKVMIFENQPLSFDGLEIQLENELPKIGKGQYGGYGAGKAAQHNGYFGACGNSGSEGAGISSWKQLPFVTALLVAANVLVFLWLEMVGSTENVLFMLQHGASEWHLVLEKGQYWRLFTCMFLHFGISHIGNNMLVLAIAGSQLEQKIGHIRYGVCYLVSGLAASLASVLWMMATDGSAVSAGASGAIYGVMGAVIALTLKERKRLGKGIVRRCAWVICLLIYGSVMQPEIDLAAHVGGLLTGALLAGGWMFVQGVQRQREKSCFPR